MNKQLFLLGLVLSFTFIVPFNLGEAFAAEDALVGYLPQEPQLDESKTVKENVLSGLGELPNLLKRFEEINAAFTDPDLDPDCDLFLDLER